MVRDPRILWAWAGGAVALAVLVTFALTWAQAASFGSGFKVGAIVGFLVWLGVDLLRYSGIDDLTLTVTLLDPVLEIVRTGLVGAILAVTLNRGSKTSATTSVNGGMAGMVKPGEVTADGSLAGEGGEGT